jgi:signal transduction histidine kinase/ActR/RegA family two-component response regulator
MQVPQAPQGPLASAPERTEGEELRRLNRTLRALSNSSQAMLRSTDEAAYLRQVCRIVVDDCGHAMVWIGFAEEDPDKTVRPVAYAGFEEGYLEALRLTWADCERGRGPTGTAIRTGKPNACTNMQTDPRFAPWREDAVRRGYASSIVFPLMAAGRAFGAISIYSRETDPFSEQEQELLAELANNLAHGITALRSRAAHQRAEEALRESERRFRLAAEELGEVDRRKSEFLAVLSHELRNPLAPICNSLYLLDHAPPGSEQAVRAKAVIGRQVGQLATLVDDLLDVTRISRGKINLERARVDACDVVRRTCEDHRAVFDRRGVELRLDLPAGPVWIDADATRISQVLGNLLQNAAKFTAARGSTAVAVAAVNGRAEIRVRDDGIGIDPELLGHVFEPFTQAERGLARAQGGLGLGLALVRGLVELHGGSAEAVSEGAHRGSELIVRLPLAAGPEEVHLEAPRCRVARARCVLVVEDYLDSGQALADVLALSGHRVHVATDGRSGIAKALEVKPDVVLCDIGLPDLDGYQVARALRAEAALRSTYLVALSGYAQAEDIRRSLDAGFDAHLGKPAPLDQLHALLASERPVPEDRPPAAGDL